MLFGIGEMLMKEIIAYEIKGKGTLIFCSGTMKKLWIVSNMNCNPQFFFI